MTAVVSHLSGSSPLARGLHHRRMGKRRLRRIIPARAGFTARRSAWSARRRDHPRSRGVYVEARGGTHPPRVDHPRSRGVYDGADSTADVEEGSSPLARGLPGGEHGAECAGRIIPARAGFTCPAPASRRRRPDHPRSRGVYARAPPPGALRWGSSPLARGLLQDEQGSQPPRRIIPARAGFTTAAPLPRSGTKDHPRSRGVYVRASRWALESSGSSPLARGLHGQLHVDAVQRRIIPARAGFTHRPQRHEVLRRDHPRSRGVYGAPTGARTEHRGSSPLARGLRWSAPGHLSGLWIIPARAGFTGRPASRSSPTWDHPRSRGVYPSAPASSASDQGSSPLARGLQVPVAERDLVLGIIPARAGFTPPASVRARTCPDHPRSRGVYGAGSHGIPATVGSSPLARGLPLRMAMSWAVLSDHPRSRGVYDLVAEVFSAEPGSSPLARGLRTGHSARDAGDGIIPARAGFTTRWSLPMPLRRDHPRSRGVYGYRQPVTVITSGSSPLARGLHGGDAQAVPGAGIIPARAGFTWTCASASSTATDHPRSRGVYLMFHPGYKTSQGSSPLARGLRRRPRR